MAVDATTAASMHQKLKLEAEADPCWLPPSPWESIPSESGHVSSSSSASHSQPPHCTYQTSAVSRFFFDIADSCFASTFHDQDDWLNFVEIFRRSPFCYESSLVRLAMNALQGVESAIITIEKLCALFCSDSADRTSHRISSLWSQALSTLALGNLFKSIGRFGCTVFLLRKFVYYFTSSSSVGNLDVQGEPSKQTLINQAFAVAVGKVLDAYISGLNTLYASVSLRRSSKANDGGCLKSVGHSEITLLEVHLHTTGLRAQIEALGNICNINDIVLSFSVSPFESLSVKASSLCDNFPRGGHLLTFLYTELKVAEPVHYALLKFLFVQSFEPYCGFIRSWIFEGQIDDPFDEFVVQYDDRTPDCGLSNNGISTSPFAAVRVRDGAAIPCFLEEFFIPFFRAGQQLQVVKKLLESSNNLGASYATREEMLPNLNLSSECRLFASPLTFDNGALETRVFARNSYYQRMLEKVETILTKFEFRYQEELLFIDKTGLQFSPLSKMMHSCTAEAFVKFSMDKFYEASAGDTHFAYKLKHISKSDHQDFVMYEGVVSPLSDRRDQNLPISKGDSESSSTSDEFCYGEDLSDSADDTSLSGSEEENESELMMHKHQSNIRLVPSYLSALDFSSSFPIDNTSQKPSQDPHMAKTTDSKGTNCQHDVHSAFGDLLEYSLFADGWNYESAWSENVDYQLEVGSRMLGVHKTDMLNYDNSIFGGCSLSAKVNSKDYHLDGPCASSSSLSLLSWKLTCHPNFLSMNPIIAQKYLSDTDSKQGERSCLNARQPFSHFDFVSVKDPLKVYVDRLTSTAKQPFGAELSASTDVFATTAPFMSDHLGKEGCVADKEEDASNICYVHTPLGLKNTDGKKLALTDASGGSGWESLLGGFGEAADVIGGDPRTNSKVAFEMPLDFVIKKCLSEEILLQYRFVSKLTIKLLEEAFGLQEHLLALRRYHFMEVADWADLFIMTLWEHKWSVAEAAKRIPEIHGALELSVQRSSCEDDPKKNRLYLYVKGDSTNPPASAIGIHSFDFLGLGYRVDWPVNIILTPDALKIYSEIFNFLIQVKLAVFFLTDSWRLLKNLVQLTKKIHRSELQKQGLEHICILLETRHQVNHFACTLQQYVQAQLSHVSWCRFLHSLKHKVKDMMDLESVHFAYLAECLDICFLSEETRPVANIIQNILQCAVDFHSCLIRSSLETGSDESTLLSELSQVDIHQVLAIKKTFAKNVKDLYLLYLKSPKHGEFGISSFWNCLNYNDYYLEIVAKQIGRHALSV